VGLEACLNRVGLLDKISSQARQLSGGEKQRLQLARVILLDPQVYLLDEPTASLDPLSARAVEGIIADMAGSGKTVILSTHNLLQARIIGQQFFFFSGGRLLQQGDGDSLFLRPLTQDIAAYSSSGNILDGTLSHHDKGCRFLSGDLSLEVTTPLPDGPAAAMIRPEDILLSRESLLSSARNSLPGKVFCCRDLGIVTAVDLEVSWEKLTAFITRESRQSMEIEAGSQLYLTCKSTSIHVMKTGT
jgi:molybdopterin-binding protein